MKRNIDGTILLVGTIGLPMFAYSKILYLFVGVKLWFRQLYKLLYAPTNVIDSSIMELTVYLVY